MAPGMSRVSNLNCTSLSLGEPQRFLDLLALMAVPSHVDNGNGRA